MNIEERFLKYISFDTQSDPHSTTTPSSMKQLELGKYLVEEMKKIGIEDAHLDQSGIVYGTIPARGEHHGPVIGFVAHMDTSPDASGQNVKPQVIRDYQGDTICLNQEKKLYLDPHEFPELLNVIHHDLITTDGTTLLGADDKAGVAIIMSMAEYLYQHPELSHSDIKIAFTPDEEVGRGTENFDIESFKADYAYTIDGGHIAEIEYENFNAFSAVVEITGKSIHPGSAKNAMINSIHIAQEFDAMLTVHARPEYTEGYEGFNHLHDIQNKKKKTVMGYIIRNHDLALAKKQCQDFENIASFLNQKYGYDMIKVTIEQDYLNMREHIEQHMYIVDNAMAAMKECCIEPYTVPIRGGTDGANLTYMGLPCPNLGTGGYNFHGPFEYVSITMMKKQVEVLLKIIERNEVM